MAADDAVHHSLALQGKDMGPLLRKTSHTEQLFSGEFLVLPWPTDGNGDWFIMLNVSTLNSG